MPTSSRGTSRLRSAPSSTRSSRLPPCSRSRSAGRRNRHRSYAAVTRSLDGTGSPRLISRKDSTGGVAERLKAAVLKTAGPKGLAGSNPASSAFSCGRRGRPLVLCPRERCRAFFPRATSGLQALDQRPPLPALSRRAGPSLHLVRRRLAFVERRSLEPDRGDSDHLHRSGGDGDAFFLEDAEQASRDPILHLANREGPREEPDRHLDPVVREPQIDAGLEVVGGEREVRAVRELRRRLAHHLLCRDPRRIETDALRVAQIDVVLERERDLSPHVIELRSVPEHRTRE